MCFIKHNYTTYVYFSKGLYFLPPGCVAKDTVQKTVNYKTSWNGLDSTYICYIPINNKILWKHYSLFSTVYIYICILYKYYYYNPGPWILDIMYNKINRPTDNAIVEVKKYMIVSEKNLSLIIFIFSFILQYLAFQL